MSRDELIQKLIEVLTNLSTANIERLYRTAVHLTER